MILSFKVLTCCLKHNETRLAKSKQVNNALCLALNKHFQNNNKLFMISNLQGTRKLLQ